MSLNLQDCDEDSKMKRENHASQTLLNTRRWRARSSRHSEAAGLGWGRRVCLSKELPDDVGAVDLWTTLGKRPVYPFVQCLEHNSACSINDPICTIIPKSCDPLTVVHQTPLSMEFSRQANWSGLPVPPPENLPNPGIEPSSPISPALADGFFTTAPPEKLSPNHGIRQHLKCKGRA